MMMRKKNGVELFYFCTKHLLPKVGACIYKNGSGAALDESACAQAFIALIGRTARLA
jgi:hypothetical protein